MKPNEDKLKALKLTVDRLEKVYSKGIVMKLGDSKVISTEHCQPDH